MSVTVRHELLVPQTGDYCAVAFAEVLGLSTIRLSRLQKFFNDRSPAGMPPLLRTQVARQQYCDYLERFYNSVLTDDEKERVQNGGEMTEFALYLLGKELRMGRRRKRVSEGLDMDMDDVGADTSDDEEDEVEEQGEEVPTIQTVSRDGMAVADLKKTQRAHLLDLSDLDTKLAQVNETVSRWERWLANKPSSARESSRAGPAASLQKSLNTGHSLPIAMATPSGTPSPFDHSNELSSSSHALHSASIDRRIGSFLISAPGIGSQIFRVPITSVGTYSAFCQVARTIFVIAEDPCLVRTDTPSDSIIHPAFWEELVGMLDNSKLTIVFPAVKPGLTLNQPDLSSFNLTIHYRFSPYLHLLQASAASSSEWVHLCAQLKAIQFPALLLTVSISTTLSELRSVITMDAASHLLTTERYERCHSLVVGAGSMTAAHSRWPSGATDEYCISEYTFASMLQPRLRLYCELQDVHLQVSME